jgi:restriction system protein
MLLSMKRLWVVRAGRFGEREDKALALARLMPGFEDVPALTGRTDRDSIIEVLRDAFPDDGENRRRNLAAQLNQFVNTMQAGDLVVMPLKQAPQVAIGRVTGNYAYDPELGHTRPVEWLRPDTPRDAFQQDLLYSFGAFMTVCEVRRNNAYMRTLAVAERKVDPGPVNGRMGPAGDRSLTIEGDASDAESVPTNLDVLARDQIRKHVAAAFAGHELTRLIADGLMARTVIARDQSGRLSSMFADSHPDRAAS